MTVVERTYRDSELPDASRAFVADTITLGWEDRLQAHGRRTTDGGIEFGLSLPRGSVLRAGDWIMLDTDRVIVKVVERPEAVFVLEPRSAPEWALWAYHIGNRHQPVMIADDAIVCPDVPGVEQLLSQQHIPYSRAVRPFTPATAVAGHQH